MGRGVGSGSLAKPTSVPPRNPPAAGGPGKPKRVANGGLVGGKTSPEVAVRERARGDGARERRRAPFFSGGREVEGEPGWRYSANQPTAPSRPIPPLTASPRGPERRLYRGIF